MSDDWEFGDGAGFADPTGMITDADVMDYGTDAAEHADWLRGLPDDVRADYESLPWAGPIESEPAGFWHHDADPGPSIGFAAGGPCDTLPPGPDLAYLAAGTDAGRAELGESQLIGVLCAWQRLISWAQAGQAATVTTLVRRRDAQARELDRPALAEHVSDEIAAALRLTGRSASQLLFMADGLDRLPEVYASLQRGEIDWAKACLFVDQLAGLSDEDAREIAAALLGRAGGMTSGQLRAALTHAVLAHDPAAAEKRRKDARADSGVHTWTETSGNAALAGRELAATDVIHASVRLTAFARWLRKHGATGTMDQLRAAVYIALLTGRTVQSLLPQDPDDPVTRPEPQIPHPHAPEPQVPQPTAAAAAATRAPTDGALPAATTGAGWPPFNGSLSAAALSGAAGGGWPQLTGTVNLTMPMSTWLGITRKPGEVANLGPVDAETCRQLAASMDPGTRWCLTVTDQAGQAIAHACAATCTAPPGQDLGGVAWAAGLATRLQYFETAPCSHARQSAGYKPSQSLRHLIEIRQRRCAFTGCRRAAVSCDLDHTVPFDKGGRTCECDLAPVCRRHHRAKQAPRWHLEQPEPGRMTWRLPSGRGYITSGEIYPV